MDNLHTLNDTLNLRDSILSIVEYIRDEGDSQASPRTILSFLTTLLKDLPIDEDGKESTITTIQKMFSGNVPYTKLQPLADQILSHQWDDVLLENIQPITETLDSISRNNSFFTLLYQQISLRFFTKSEYKELQSYYESQEYSKFILAIMKHGFATMYNIPCFFANRIYEEALTYDFDSPLRFALMRTAAEKGNKNAALEYGNFISKPGSYTEAFRYLLLAIPLPAAIWNIAYLLEKQYIGPDQLRQFKTVFKTDEKIASDDFSPYRAEVDSIICTETNPVYYNNLLYAYKTYFYLAYKGFFKAFNSMAKLLISNKFKLADLTLPFDEQSLSAYYYQKAIKACNVPAMCSEGDRILNNYMSSSSDVVSSLDEQYMLELIKTSADADMITSCYNLGRYYEFTSLNQLNTDIHRMDIERIYMKAIDLDTHGSPIRGDLLYRLGNIATDIPQKRKHFQDALSLGVSDAAYSLALIYYKDFSVTQQILKLLEAKELIANNISYMTPETRERAKLLQAQINQIIL